MRFGAHVFGYTDAESWARKHVEHGYGAAYFPLSYRDDPEKIEAYVDAARRHKLVIAEIGIWNNQLDRDPEKRAQYFHDAMEQFKLADHIGARCCVNIAGSLGDTWDDPHPDNLTDDTLKAVVRNIQAIIDAAKPKNCYYTLEPMPWMFPRNVEDTIKPELWAHVIFAGLPLLTFQMDDVAGSFAPLIIYPVYAWRAKKLDAYGMIAAMVEELCHCFWSIRDENLVKDKDREFFKKIDLPQLPS